MKEHVFPGPQGHCFSRYVRSGSLFRFLVPSVTFNVSNCILSFYPFLELLERLRRGR